MVDMHGVHAFDLDLVDVLQVHQRLTNLMCKRFCECRINRSRSGKFCSTVQTMAVAKEAGTLNLPTATNCRLLFCQLHGFHVHIDLSNACL